MRSVQGSARERLEGSLSRCAPPRALGHTHRHERLDRRRVDADGAVEVVLGRAAPHGHRKALRHLARARAAHVQADDTRGVGRVADELRVARGLGAARVCELPLEWLEVPGGRWSRGRSKDDREVMRRRSRRRSAQFTAIKRNQVFRRTGGRLRCAPRRTHRSPLPLRGPPVERESEGIGRQSEGNRKEIGRKSEGTRRNRHGGDSGEGLRKREERKPTMPYSMRSSRR